MRSLPQGVWCYLFSCVYRLAGYGAVASATDFFSPVRQQLLQCCVQVGGGLPASGVSHRLGAAGGGGDIGGTHAFRVLGDLDLDAAHGEHFVEDVLNLARLAGADVEAARVVAFSLGQLQQLYVGGANVVDIEEVAAGVQVANLEHGLLLAGLDQGDLAGEGGGDEVGRLLCADMIERAHDDAGLALAEVFVERCFGRKFTRRVGIERLALAAFAEGDALFEAGAVDLGGADEQHEGVRRLVAQGLQQVNAADDVGLPGQQRFLEAHGDVGDSRKVDDVGRLHFGDGLLQGGCVADVTGHGLLGVLRLRRGGASEGDDVMSGLLQDLAQDLPNEAVGACNEDALHGRFSLIAVRFAGQFNRAFYTGWSYGRLRTAFLKESTL